MDHWGPSGIEALVGRTPAEPAAASEKERPWCCSAFSVMDGKGWGWKQIDAFGDRRNGVVQRRNAALAAELEMVQDEESANEAYHHELAGDGGEAGAGAVM